MNIELATAEKIAIAHELIKSAARRIQAKGSIQWAHVLRDQELPILEDWMNQKAVFFGKNEQEYVAVCYLYTNKTDWDDQLWSQPQVRENVFYLHKLSLADGYTGKGLANDFLLSLQKFVTEEFGNSTIIRLDCMAEKAVLNQLYQKAGFQKVGVAEKIGTPDFTADFNLYEWKI